MIYLLILQIAQNFWYVYLMKTEYFYLSDRIKFIQFQNLHSHITRSYLYCYLRRTEGENEFSIECSCNTDRQADWCAWDLAPPVSGLLIISSRVSKHFLLMTVYSWQLCAYISLAYLFTKKYSLMPNCELLTFLKYGFIILIIFVAQESYRCLWPMKKLNFIGNWRRKKLQSEWLWYKIEHRENMST